MTLPQTYFFTLLLLVASAARAELTSRNEVGLGVTNNANLETTDTDASLFSRFVSANQYDMKAARLGVRLSLQDYFSQHEQDALSWKAKNTWKKPEVLGKTWDPYMGFLGQHYLNGSPFTSEASFDFVGIQTGVERQFQFSEGMELVLNPEYELKPYLNFQGRVDNTLGILAELSRPIGKDMEITGDAGLALCFSSLPEYSRTILELGGSLFMPLEEKLSLSVDTLLRTTAFSNRTITTATTVSNRRGRTFTTSSLDNEVHYLWQLGGELVYRLTASVNAGGGLRLSLQSSRSGVENYSSLEFLVKGIFFI